MTATTQYNNISDFFPAIAETFGCEIIGRNALTIGKHDFNKSDSARALLHVIRSEIYSNDESLFAEDLSGECPWLVNLIDLARREPEPVRAESVKESAIIDRENIQYQSCSSGQVIRKGTPLADLLFGRYAEHGVEAAKYGSLVPVAAVGTDDWYKQEKLILQFEGWDDRTIEKRHAELKAEFMQEGIVANIVKMIYFDDVEMEEDSPEYSKPVLHGDDPDLMHLVLNSWDAIAQANHPERLFNFANISVRIIPEDNAVVIDALDKFKLQLECATAADWVVIKRKEHKPARPPLNVVQPMLALDKKPLPHLSRIVYAPVFNSDGKIISKPGYDPESKIYYYPGNLKIQPIPENPSNADVEAAKKLINEMFQDFPFASDADRAHAWAALFPIPCREMIGNMPANLIESPDAGTGKGLLCECILIPYTGGDWEKFSPTGSEEEERKRYTGALRNGKSAWIFDNYNELKGAQISAILTTGKWSDRTLSKSETVTCDVKQQIIVTGNNTELSKETGRRVLKCRIDARTEFPSLRTGFKIANLEKWVYAHRADIVRAILTIVQSWVQAGRPKPTVEPLGSYTDFCNVIGGILQHIGINGFLGNVIQVLEKSDIEGRVEREFISDWWNVIKMREYNQRPMKAAELYNSVKSADQLDISGKDKNQRQKSFSYKMTKLKDRIFTINLQNDETITLQIVDAGKSRDVSQWTLEDLSQKQQSIF